MHSLGNVSFELNSCINLTTISRRDILEEKNEKTRGGETQHVLKGPLWLLKKHFKVP